MEGSRTLSDVDKIAGSETLTVPTPGDTPMRLRFAAFVVCLIACLASLQAQEPSTERRPIRLDDLFEIKRVGDPRFSPDSGWVAYTVSESSLEKDRSETSIWMVSTSDGAEMRMTRKGTSGSQPRWSPDGKYLSFRSGRPQGEFQSGEESSRSQVWLLNRRGGEAQQLTDIEQGVSGHEWSPDGKQLVLLIKDPKPGESEDGQEAEKKPIPWVIDRLQFKRDRIGYLDRLRTHLYLFDVQNRETRQLTFGDYADSEPVWSPDGKWIAFVSNRSQEPDANSNSDIWVLSTVTREARPSLKRITTNPGSDTNPAWSPDGKYLAHVTITQPDLIWYAGRKLAISPFAGGRAEILTADLDRNVSQPRFDPDGKAIYFRAEDGRVYHLARLELENRRLTRPLGGKLKVSSFTMSPAGRLAVLKSEPRQPNEVFLLDNLPRQLSFRNSELLNRLKLGKVEDIRFASKDGSRIEGFVVKPPDFVEGRRYPTLLRIHGGPVFQFFFDFNFEAQLFASQGYLVVMANPRGSSGYGQEFAMGIWQAWGQKDFEDVMAAVDHAVESGWADPQRLGVGGWSYGGILTNYVITQTDRFKAAITGASEVLYVANYGHDHYQLQWEKELGLPWENRELWERLSPFNYVEKIVTPTLIMGGEKDWNVPILNSEQLYQALKRLGRETLLVVYPGESHGIRRPTFLKDRRLRALDWYDKYVKGWQPEAAGN